jgi:magnesium transporter
MNKAQALLFKQGKLEAKMHSLEATLPNMKDEFIWVDLKDPTQKEFEVLEKRFSLHPLAVEDAMGDQQVPKLDFYDQHTFTVLKTAELVNDSITYNEISIFLGARFIIVVRHGKFTGYEEFCSRLESASAVRHMGPDFILHGITDFIVDSYFPIIQMIEDAVLGFEQQMLESFLSREQITRIFRFRREVIHFQRMLGKMSELAGKFVHLKIPCLSNEVKPYFNDAMDHLQRLDVLGSTLIDIITSVFEASNLLEQQRQGVITRQLAAWAGIVAVPTAIAGLYGMNFKNIPELSFRYGYPITLLAMLLISALLYRKFKGVGWL